MGDYNLHRQLDFKKSKIDLFSNLLNLCTLILIVKLTFGQQSIDQTGIFNVC